MAWIIFGAGVVLTIFGLITTSIAYKFDEWNTTPFSEQTFAKSCYELTDVCESCLKIGLTISVVSLIFT